MYLNYTLNNQTTSVFVGTAGAPLKPLRDDSALRALSSLRGLIHLNFQHKINSNLTYKYEIMFFRTILKYANLEKNI